MENKEANIKNILSLIKLKKRFILLFVIISTVLVLAYSFIMPVSYLSEASILPPESKSGMSLPGFLSEMAGSMSMLSGIGSGGKSDVYANIIKSRSVAEFVVEDAELRKYELFQFDNDYLLYDFVRSLVQVYVDKSGIILINCNLKTSYFPSKSDTDTIANLSSQILNSAIKGLDRILIERSLSSAKASKEYIQSEIITYRNQLDSIELHLVEFQKAHNILEIEDQVKAIVQQAIDVGSLMAEAEIQMNLASIEFDEKSPTYNMYNQKYQLLRNQYNQIQQGGINEQDAFSIPLNDVPELIKDFTNLYRDKKILEQVIIFLETQKHQEAIQEKRDVPIVKVLDYALTPTEKYSPKRKIMLIVTVFSSFLLSILTLVGISLYKGKLYLDTV